MAKPIKFQQPILLPADPANNLEAATKQYVDAIASGRVAVGGAAADYMGTAATMVAANSSYNANDIPVGQKTYIARTGNTNVPAGSDTFYYIETLRIIAGAVIQQAIGASNGEHWIRTQNGSTWSSWVQYMTTTANAASATKLATARTIGLTGVINATGVSFNGTANITLTTSIDDGALTIAKVAGLQTALNAKLEAGAFGLGVANNNYDWSGTDRQSRFAGGNTNPPMAGLNVMGVRSFLDATGLYAASMVARNDRMWFQTTENGTVQSWRELYHTGNLDLSTKLDVGATAVAAAKLATARTIAVAGVVTGSGTFDGSANLSITTSIANNALTIAKTSGLQAALDAKANANAPAFTGGMTVTGDIIPSADNTYSLGSPTRAWRDMYVGPGSLYLNGQKILEDTESGTIRMTADANQNIAVQTYGTGDVELAPQGTGMIQLKGSVMFQAGSKLRTTTGAAFLFDDDISFSAGTGLTGAVTIDGNLAYHAGNLDLSTKLDATGTAAAATKLATARNFALSGLVTASAVSFNGTGNVTLNTTIADGALTIAKVSGLQAALNNKVDAGGAIDTANKLATPRTIALGGLLSGSAAFDGSANITISAAMADNALTIAKTNGLQAALNAKADLTRKYHAFTEGEYIWEGIEGRNSSRIYLESSRGDAMRYCPVTDVEYWDQTAGAWTAWPDGVALIQRLLDGQISSPVQIQRPYRKFRFSVTKNNAYPSDVLFVMETSWTPVAFVPVAFTIENRTASNPVTWVTRASGTFGPGTTSGGWGMHAFYTTQLHDGISLSRVTMDITDWVDSGASNSFPLYRLMMLSQYGATSRLNPWTVDYSRRVTFDATPYVGSNKVWTEADFNPATKLDATANAASATKLATPRNINGVAFDGTANIDINTFGRVTINDTMADLLILNRTGASANSAIAFKTTAGTVYAGNGSGSNFAISGDANLNHESNPWMRVSATAAWVSNRLGVVNTGTGESWLELTSGQRFDGTGGAAGRIWYRYSDNNFGFNLVNSAGVAQTRLRYDGQQNRWRFEGGDAVLIENGTVLHTANLASIPDAGVAIAKVDGLQTALDGKLGATANAATATRLATARTIALGGLLGGSASFNGSANVTITATMADAALTIAKTSGLQAALDGKLDNGAFGLGTVNGGYDWASNERITRFTSGLVNGPIQDTSVMGFRSTLNNTNLFAASFVGRNSRAFFQTIENGTVQAWNEIYHTGNLPTDKLATRYGYKQMTSSSTGYWIKLGTFTQNNSSLRDSLLIALTGASNNNAVADTSVIADIRMLTTGAVGGQKAVIQYVHSPGSGGDNNLKLIGSSTSPVVWELWYRASSTTTWRNLSVTVLAQNFSFQSNVTWNTESDWQVAEPTGDYTATVVAPTFAGNRLLTEADGAGYMPTTWSITAGNGMSGGGTGAAARTLTMGTPTTLSGSTTNAVTATSHTHALSTNLKAWDAITPASKLDVNGSVASAAKLTTARNIYLVGDLIGNVAFDGSTDVSITGRQRSYTHGGTGNQYAGQYTRVARITLAATYEDSSATLQMLGYGDGSTYNRKILVSFRAKQQVSLPGLPYVNVDIERQNYMNPEDFYAVIGDTTSYPIYIDLYAKMSGTYSGLKSTVVARGGSRALEVFENDGYVTELPAGTVVQGQADASRVYGSTFIARDSLSVAGNDVWHAGNLSKSILHTTDTVSTGDLRFSSNNGRGVRFWDSDSYKIWMAQAADTTWGGRGPGETTSDYNMYFRMTGSGTNRGFVFENAYSQKLFSINPNGVRSNVDVTAPNFYGYLNGNVGGGNSVTVVNPSNGTASMSMSWLSNYPRLRIGGTGTGAGAIFRIQGESDFTRMSLDSGGNLTVPGYLDGKNSLNRVILPTTGAAAQWLKLGSATWSGASPRYLQFEAATGNYGTRRMARDIVTVSNRSYTNSITALTQALVDGMVDHQRIVHTEGASAPLQVGLVLTKSGSTSTGIEIWVKIGVYNSGVPLTLINNDGIAWEARDNAVVTTEPADIIYATPYDILNRSLMDSDNTWSGTQYFEASNTHFGSKATSNVILEIGGRQGTATSTGLDFHSSGGNNDFDSRIMATGGNGTTNGAGTITMSAATFTLTGVNFNVPINGRITFGSNSTILRDAGAAGTVLATANASIFLRPQSDTGTANQVVLSTTSFTVGGNKIYHAGNQLDMGETAATGRTALALGDLATMNFANVVEQGTGATLGTDGSATPSTFFTDVTSQFALKYSNNTTNSTNYPTQFGGTMSVIMGRQNTRSFDLHITTGSARDLYFRGYGSTGTPAPWGKMWTSVNHGANSGLDADTVDGLEASSFFRSDSTNSTDVRFAQGDGRGMRFWDNDNYKIWMSAATNATNGGRIAGDTTSDYNMYFRMATGTNRGFVFENSYGSKLFSINGNGVRSTPAITAPSFIGALTGNAATATKLATARTINGVSFDGTANITISASWAGGAVANKVAINGAAIGSDNFSALNVAGGIKSRGSFGALGFEDRDTTTTEWNWYSSGGIARLWNNTGDKFAFDNNGQMVAKRVGLNDEAPIHLTFGGNTFSNTYVWGPEGAGDDIIQITRNGKKNYKISSFGDGQYSGQLRVGYQLYLDQGWFRSQQSGTGWFNEAHGGGIFMQDNQWVRVYNNKGFLISGAAGNDGGLRLEGSSPTVTFYDTDSGQTNWLHCNDGNIGFLANNAFAWATYRDGSNNWIVTGNIAAYASDERLKHHITFAGDQVRKDFFDGFKVREYDWNYEAIAELHPNFKPSADHEVGAIAQEVELIYPHMVTDNSTNGIKTILWDKAVPLLIAEVQDLRKQVAELQDLRGMVEKLAARVAEMGGA